MRLSTTSSLAISLVLSLAPLSLSGQTRNVQASDRSQSQPGGQGEAMQMVPGRATLLSTLDAKKSQLGQTFQAKLVGSVHLKNGPELPSGTLLTGSIEKDDMQQGGMSRLAVRLTSATLKGGTSLPIKATIVGVSHPDNSNSNGNSGQNDDSVPNTWNDGTLAVDQINVMSDTDLHSRIASRNSGVFISSKKDNITLHSGSELQLAIAASQGQNGEGGSGMTTAAANTH